MGHWLVDDGGSDGNEVDFVFYYEVIFFFFFKYQLAVGSPHGLFLLLECCNTFINHGPLSLEKLELGLSGQQAGDIILNLRKDSVRRRGNLFHCQNKSAYVSDVFWIISSAVLWKISWCVSIYSYRSRGEKDWGKGDLGS